MQNRISLSTRLGRRSAIGALGLLATTILASCSTSSSSQSNVDTLSSLTVSSGSLNPGFSPTVYAYGVLVANSVTSITVTPTATSGVATLAVRGIAVTSGSSSAAQPLTIGPNLIDVVVTAQDGTFLIYNITVTRAAS